MTTYPIVRGSHARSVLSVALILGLPSLVAFFFDSESTEIYTCTLSPNYGDAVLLAPQPMNGTTYTITVLRDGASIGADKVVQVVFDSSVRTCADAVHQGVTGEDGSCQITLRGGGCATIPTTGACSILCNGLVVRNLSRVRSPDNGAHTNSEPDGSVSVADLVFFAEEFRGTAPAGCHDYTNDGQVSTGDLPFFGDAFKTGMTCALR